MKYVKVRYRHKGNILCIPWCNLTLKSSVFLIWWSWCVCRPVNGNASTFRPLFILYLTILHAAKYSQVEIYLVKAPMNGRIPFFYRALWRASIKNITRFQKCCMKVKSSNLWIFLPKNHLVIPLWYFQFNLKILKYVKISNKLY